MSPRAADRDQAILAAAVDLFYRKGFHAVSMDELGEQAGMSGPNLYRHFRSKQEILLSIVDQAHDDLAAMILPTTGDPRQDCDNLIRSQVKFILIDRPVIAVYVRESRSLDPVARRRITRRQRQHVQRWLDAFTACWPNASPLDVQRTVQSVLDMLRAVSQWPEETFQTPDVESHLLRMSRAMVATLDDSLG